MKLPIRFSRSRGIDASLSGMTLVEILVAMLVIVVASGLYMQTTLAALALEEATWQRAQAAEGARRVLESMRNEELVELFALYNADPNDDPAGPGTAPGAAFAVAGLDVLPDDADQLTGEVHLPARLDPVAKVWQLREDAVDLELGLPRDLNGDSLIDDADHAGDYIHLPMRIRVRWRGRSGPQELGITTMMVAYQR